MKNTASIAWLDGCVYYIDQTRFLYDELVFRPTIVRHRRKTGMTTVQIAEITAEMRAEKE